MKKFIFILNAMNLLEVLASGKRVEGVLFLDKNTGKLTFKPYFRRKRQRKDKLIKKLPWGWVKESVERIKVFGSFPKDEGTAGAMCWMEEHHRDAKNALIEKEIKEFC